MVVGDPSLWASRFTSIDDRLLQRIVAIWPQCLAVLPTNPDEDLITTNLVNLLLKDVEARQLFYWLEYQFHAWGFTPEGLAYSKGIIDIAVLLDQERERYLAYECKRLNVLYNGSRQSLAVQYVNEGLSRFINERYAEALPIGCMLGYVMDGDIAFALSKVHAALAANKAAIGLTDGPTTVSPIVNVERFSSLHVRSTSEHTIQVRHAFLPFPTASK